MGLFKPNVEKLEAKKDVKGLIKALEYEKDQRVREDAGKALENIKNEKIEIKSLIQALKDKDWFVRSMAAKILGNIRDKRAVEPLIQALKDTNSSVRISVAEALGNIRDKRAVEPLIQAFEEDLIVRPKIAEALTNIRDKKAVEMLYIYTLKYEKERELIEKSIKLEDEYFSESFTILKSVPWWNRKDLAEILGKLRDKRAIEPLMQTLKDDDWEVREKAAEALGKIGDVRAIEPLMQTLKDENEYVRENAALALDSIKAKIS